MKTDIKFDQQEIKKQVLNATIQHPLTLFPAGIGFLGGLGFAMFSSPMFSIMAVSGVTIASGAWVINYFKRKQYFTDEYIKNIQKQIQDEREKVLVNLKEKLKEAQDLSIEEEYTGQALKQLELSQDSFNNFIEVLDQKLTKGEITYGRFLVSAEQTYLSIVDNLQKIAHVFNGVKTIDPTYLEQRIKALKVQKNKKPADFEEEEHILERKKVLEDALSEINDILTENEKALTVLEKATISISKVKMQKGQAESNVNDALVELEDMIKRSKNYNID